MFHNGYPIHGVNRKTIEVMTLYVHIGAFY